MLPIVRPFLPASTIVVLIFTLAVPSKAQTPRGAGAGEIIIQENASNQQAHSTSDRQTKLSVPGQSIPIKPVHTGKGRQTIFSKLESIRFDSIAFDNLPLGEVVKTLTRRTKNLDPENLGINFIVIPSLNNLTANQAQDGPAIANGPTPAPIASSGEVIDLNALAINLVAPLEDIRLLDVLEILTKIAPIRYSVEDYGVIFRLKTREDFLYVRTFKVDPNTFMQGLESVTGFPFGSAGAGGAGTAQGGGQNGGILTLPRVSVAPTAQGSGGGAGAGGAGGISGVTRPVLRSAASGTVIGYFNSLGLNLTPPKGVSFDDRSGTLVVRATTQDLETISSALELLSGPQVAR